MHWSCLSFPVFLGASAAALAAEMPAVVPENPATNHPVYLFISALPVATLQVFSSAPLPLVLQVERSLDLESWTNWSETNLLTSASVSFPIELGSSQMFFRARVGDLISSNAPRAAEIVLGRRLFEEIRFAQFFAANCGGDVNRPLTRGDPTLGETQTLTEPLPGAFAGQTVSCRSCHFLGEQVSRGVGMRAFSDFAIRSPVPSRNDGRSNTVRNTPALINASVDRPGPFFLHYDGQFADPASLTVATLTGRNFGWLPNESGLAVAHVARVIREDEGTAFRGPSFGGPYRDLLSGRTAPASANSPIPATLRIDALRSSDIEVVDAVGKLVEVYLQSLRFKTSASGDYEGSPYDAFLRKNRLPRKPNGGESAVDYSRRLRSLLRELEQPSYVTEADGAFKTLPQSFAFGPKELDGLKIFLGETDPEGRSEQGRVGNCLVCHAPPHFTDFAFHNTGATQWEYDAVHGEGAFSKLAVPSLDQRLGDPDKFLPPTGQHPNATGRFLAIPKSDQPGFVDLGLWNVYANSDFFSVQASLERILSERFSEHSPDALLAKTIASFKTPGLRALGFSGPYLHTGQASSLEALIFFYRFTSDLARDESVRNGDPEIARIVLSKEDAAPLIAFLRSLNEDISHE